MFLFNFSFLRLGEVVSYHPMLTNIPLLPVVKRGINNSPCSWSSEVVADEKSFRLRLVFLGVGWLAEADAAAAEDDTEDEGVLADELTEVDEDGVDKAAVG